ncbi:MAG: YcgL domain-containing protein [Pseudomonadales bacterium]|nr:YcgL domain-containing protein [Pseudomonadales bacterium]
MSDEQLLCTIYGGSREAEMYLYVARAEGLARVPEELLNSMGEIREVLTLKLHPTRKLARAKAEDVLAAIHERGYYLQLPPNKMPRQFSDGD